MSPLQSRRHPSVARLRSSDEGLSGMSVDGTRPMFLQQVGLIQSVEA